MIPKIIHFVWFSDNAMFPEDVEKCISSWKEKMPDYEIKMWNDRNFDFSICRYADEAFKEGKYAFASDYVRLYALYNFGGIYLDTDVEVLRSFDSLLNCKAFAGFEDKNKIAPSILGAEKGNLLFKQFMDDYNDRRFILGEGQYDLTPNPIPVTKRLIEHNLKLDGSRQELDLISIYPMDYFCPFNPYRESGECFTENTYCNHHFSGSWTLYKTKNELKYDEKEAKYIKIFGKKLGHRICKHTAIISHIGLVEWCKRYLLKRK